jgi:hypothetical protein
MPTLAVEVVANLLAKLTGTGSRSNDDDPGKFGVAHAVAGECLGIGDSRLTSSIVGSGSVTSAAFWLVGLVVVAYFLQKLCG